MEIVPIKAKNKTDAYFISRGDEYRLNSLYAIIFGLGSTFTIELHKSSLNSIGRHSRFEASV